MPGSRIFKICDQIIALLALAKIEQFALYLLRSICQYENVRQILILSI